MKFFPQFFAIALIVVSVFTGCKKDEDSPTQPPAGNTATTYVGTIASATESGTISLVVAASGASESQLVVVTGTLRLVGTTDTIPLSGTMNGDTLDVTGGGYTFDGALSSGSINGTYTGPNGNGSFVANPTSGGAARVFVGSYSEDAPGTEHGTFNMIINANNTIDAIVVNGDTGESTPFEGTLTGSTISVFVPGTPSAVVATGTLKGTGVSGTYNTGTSTGTWSGELF